MAIDGGKNRSKQPAAEVETGGCQEAPGRSSRQIGGLARHARLFTAGEETGNADTLFGDFHSPRPTNEQIERCIPSRLAHLRSQHAQHDTKLSKFRLGPLPHLTASGFGLSSFTSHANLPWPQRWFGPQRIAAS